MLLTPAQKEVVRCDSRFRVLNCGRRFGKTTLAVEEMIGCALSKDNKQIAYIAPTYQQARDIAWEMLKNRVRTVARNINESRLEVSIMTQDGGTSRIVLRGWESIESLRGQKFDFLVVDEVAMMRNFWAGWQEVLRPTLTDTRGQCMFISTPKGFNHFYDLYTLEKEPEGKDYRSFHFTSYDNPNVPADEIDQARLELPEDKFAQEYMADFRKMEGLIYKEFERQEHVVDKVPEGFSRIMAAIDFGYTNPYALLVIGIDRDEHYWVLEERYATGKTTAEIIETAKTLQNDYKISRWYPDPAEPDRIAEMRKSGLNCVDVRKDVEAGIDHVREMFKTNRIHIYKSCVNLIGELETYRYEPEKPNKNAPEKPVKEKDHAVDALRYALFTTKPIQTKTVKRAAFSY